MQLTNEFFFYSNKKSIKYFIIFIEFFSFKKNIFVNGNFLTKLDKRLKLNKFKISLNELED